VLYHAKESEAIRYGARVVNSHDFSKRKREMSDEAELDLIWGAAAIGRAIRKERSAVYHMLESGLLPARKHGGQWVARRADLERHFTAKEQERAA
jgi:hypothetical protein